MRGKPKYDYGDIVEFEIKENDEIITLTGSIYIVDAYGTFFQNDEPSYDIMVEHSHYDGEKCLYKHISERFVSKKDE